MSQSEIIEVVLKHTEPLKVPRGDRLPLYVWPIVGVGTSDDGKAEEIIEKLNDRGIAMISSWSSNGRAQSLAEGLRIGAIQKKLGLPVNVNANALMHRFCNGDPRTAHVTAEGEQFFDGSFDKNVKMGCPFALKFRYPTIKERIEYFAREYKQQGIDVDVIFADWEIDGAIEWNGAWAHAKKCMRCRENIRDIEDFSAFQRAIREIRCEMQREVYAEVMKSYFPNVLVGNYGVYPHDGYRYWYDYFEEFVEGAPYRADGRAKYRQWFQEFPLTGYTFAMPVVYTWYPTFHWYDFENPDYRWFYNMLLVATNAAKHAPAETPVLTFVHWHTTSPPKAADPQVKQFSEQNYQELLWHMLLRGNDTFFLWCPRNEIEEEVQLVHEVYAASLGYKEFLSKGEPITFHVPKNQGPVVSGLRLGKRLLVRRTDFDDDQRPMSLKVGDQTIHVPRVERKCQLLTLP